MYIHYMYIYIYIYLFIYLHLPTGSFVCPRAPPAAEAQPNSTHSSFRVPNFRGWFGVQIIGCTFKHILHCTFRVFKLRDWFGAPHASSAPFKEYYTPGQTKEPVAVNENHTSQLKNVPKYASPMDVGWYGFCCFFKQTTSRDVCVFFLFGSGLEGHQLQNHRGTIGGFGWTVRWWQEYSDVSPSAFL